MAGRPTSCTPDVTARIAEALRLGMSIEGSCAAGPIALSTYHDWVARGNAGEEPFADFSDAVSRARHEAEQHVVGIIKNAVPQDPHLAVKWWEKRYLTAPPKQVEISGRNGGPIEVTDDALSKRVRALRPEQRAKLDELVASLLVGSAEDEEDPRDDPL